MDRPAVRRRWHLPRPWRAPLLALALLGMAVAACGGGSATQPGPGEASAAPGTVPPTQAPRITVNRITYVSPEDELFTINPDGSDPRRLTGDVQVHAMGRLLAQPAGGSDLFTWPTWSPDGTKLAASRIQIANGQARISIQVINVATGRAKTVFDNDPSLFSLVADTAPHYLYWSPDSRSLAFIAPTGQGLTLFVQDTETQEAPKAVPGGAPIYFHWAGDGSAILLHTVRELRLVEKPFDTAPARLVADAGGFRAPAFSPDGRRMAYTVASQAGSSLLVAQAGDPASASPVLEVGALAAFLWSPDGAELAVLDQEEINSPVFQRLRVVTLADGATRTIAEEPVMAVYWSPNGERIAWITLSDPAAAAFDWKVAPRSGAPVRQLLHFRPSREVLTMLSFFDQFAYSHSPWSPDSTRLVVAGTRQVAASRQDGQTPTGDRIVVLDAAGAAPPREITAGTLAFWSWN